MSLGGGPVHRLRVPGRVVDVALVLDADGRGVGAAGVPGGVLLQDRLGDLTVRGADRVVRADLRRRVLVPADGTGVRPLGGVDDHLVDGCLAADDEVPGVGGHPPRRRVVGARGVDVGRRHGVLVGGDRPGGHEHLLAARRGGGHALGQEGVDGVRVERGGRPLGGAVAGHRRIPGVDVPALGGVQAQRVGVVAQDGRAAEDVGGRVPAQPGRALAGQLGGLLQGAVGRIARQVHHAVAVRLAGPARVAVETALAVADGGQQIARYAVRVRRLGERAVHRVGRVRPRGGGRRVPGCEEGRGREGRHGAGTGTGPGSGGGAEGHGGSCSVGVGVWGEEKSPRTRCGSEGCRARSGYRYGVGMTKR
ncbi:hypothetical protein SGRI78S_01438 [Streptomyces griseus subsp. griseus]